MIKSPTSTESIARSKLPGNPHKRLVLFHRDFRRFTGGHLKVWNYFNHVNTSESYRARIAFTPESTWNGTNPWANSKEYVTEWAPETADILFLAGADWKRMPSELLAVNRKPIINLIQHPRHADPEDELYPFLKNRAIRICVSEQVAQAIKATRKVNGPIFVIPNGIALDDIPVKKSANDRPIDVLICGLKAPDLARKVEQRLPGKSFKVRSLLEWIPRTDYLERLNSARIAVTLPRPIEGFYLPAIEAMASGALVVCPDCVGNRDFCHDGVNCFRPAYDEQDIAEAVDRAIALSPQQATEMREQTAATVAKHSLERERTSFFQILDRVDKIWADV